MRHHPLFLKDINLSIPHSALTRFLSAEVAPDGTLAEAHYCHTAIRALFAAYDSIAPRSVAILTSF